jgi:hypothetical protein
METQGTYTIRNSDNYELEIEYNFYSDDGDYESPPEGDITIIKVLLNGMVITDFYHDYLASQLSEDLWNYAQN